MKYEEIFYATFKTIRKALDPDEFRRSVDFSIPSMPIVEACRADDFDFFAPIIATGRLSVEQMHHACQRYYLGKTKSGQPIFWMIDDMLTPLDAHIGTTWISTLLKVCELRSFRLRQSVTSVRSTVLISRPSSRTRRRFQSRRSTSRSFEPYKKEIPLFINPSRCPAIPKHKNNRRFLRLFFLAPALERA